MPIHDWTRVDAGTFHDHHQVWIGFLRVALNGGILPRGFYAQVEQRPRPWEPDVLTLESPSTANEGSSELPSGGLSLAVATPRPRLRVKAEAGHYAGKSSYLTIRHSRGHRIVAVIEIVSPGNKASQIEIDRFVQKSIDLLRQGYHLLVVDLFPPGPRDPQGIHGLIWAEIDREPFLLPPDEQLTLVSYQAGTTEEAFIEPTAVGRLLVEMPLFLGGEVYVNVPLEEAYMTSFRTIPDFAKEILEA